MQNIVKRLPPEYGKIRNSKHERPAGGNFTEMMMPEIWSNQWENGYGKKYSGKRDSAPEGKDFTKVLPFMLCLSAFVFHISAPGSMIDHGEKSA